MKIALVQVNPKVGDFERNAQLVLDRAREARAAGADVVVFPEMALCGYPPLDLLSFPSFVAANLRSARPAGPTTCRPELLDVCRSGQARAAAGFEKGLVNTVAALYGGEVVFEQAKTLLPTYDVFDERRFSAAPTAGRGL